MDFNTGRLDSNKNSGSGKRKARSVQDMIGSDFSTGSEKKSSTRIKSGYSGPYKQRTGPITWNTSPLPEPKSVKKTEGKFVGRTGNTGKIVLPESDRDTRDAAIRQKDAYIAPGSRASRQKSAMARGDISSYVWMIYTGVLLICLIVSIIVYLVGGGSSGSSSGSSKKLDSKLMNLYDELNSITTSEGIVKDLVSGYVTGDGYSGSKDEVVGTSTSTIVGATSADQVQTTNPDGTIATTNGPDVESGVTSSGIPMVLDSGNGMEGYTSATSHSELVTQLESALSSGDTAFVGSKLSYKDDYGELTGYPESVVEHFTSYMASNAEKRADFIKNITSESHSATNGSAYIAVLQPIQFVVNMGYDETTVSVEGFGDQVVNNGQQAIIKPLLPCMYTVTMTNSAWGAPVVREVEANMSEQTLNLNVK